MTLAPGRVIFLGTGTSHGVPMIGCDCAVCRSTDPRDRRLRPSIYIDVPDRAGILVDTSTDLRQQALAHQVRRVDAVLFTHAHADHIMGLDELRRFNELRGGSIPAYATADTWASIEQTFRYAFDQVARKGGGVPRIERREVAGPFDVGGVPIVPVPIWHGDALILGYRIGDFAYLTDGSLIPDESWALLDGVRTLVVNALRHRSHSTHFSVAEALQVVDRVRPARGLLTHMCHELGHAETNRNLPAHVELAYDGLVVALEVPVT